MAFKPNDHIHGSIGGLVLDYVPKLCTQVPICMENCCQIKLFFKKDTCHF
jgi:hypothetical protein